MSCPLPQNAKLTQAETTLGSSDTLMSQLVTEQLNFRVKEPSGDLEPHSNKLGAEGSRNPALLSLGHIQLRLWPEQKPTKRGGQTEAKFFTGTPVSSAELSFTKRLLLTWAWEDDGAWWRSCAIALSWRTVGGSFGSAHSHSS